MDLSDYNDGNYHRDIYCKGQFRLQTRRKFPVMLSCFCVVHPAVPTISCEACGSCFIEEAFLRDFEFHYVKGLLDDTEDPYQRADWRQMRVYLGIRQEEPRDLLGLSTLEFDACERYGKFEEEQVKKLLEFYRTRLPQPPS